MMSFPWAEYDGNLNVLHKQASHHTWATRGSSNKKKNDNLPLMMEVYMDYTSIVRGKRKQNQVDNHLRH